MSQTIIALAGDGIGPEIMEPALALLRELGDFSIEHHLFGGASIDATGEPIADEVVALCHSADAVLVAAAGGPKWDTTDPAQPRPEQALMRLREELGLYANLRPVKTHDALLDASPLRPEVVRSADVLIVRELTGGLYFGKRGRTGASAFDTCEYSIEEVERIARVAFRAVRRHVTSVDKANVLETSRLWRETIDRIHRDEFPQVELRHILVDNAAMQLMRRPRDFDVIVTENLFGDILSDEAANLTGSIALLPSASIGDSGPGLFEPIHGSAPDIAGQGVASPLAMFLTTATMLRHGLGKADEADRLEAAVNAALEGGLRTPDLGGTSGTKQAYEAVRAQI